MRRFLKISSIVLGSLIGLILLTVISVYFLLQSDYIRNEAQSRVGAALGRETRIGSTQIDWGWTTHVKLQDVKIANAEWGKTPHMLEAQLVDFEIELWPLVSGSFVLPRIEIGAPKILLERNKNGAENWSFKESPGLATVAEVAAPEERDEAPTIGKLAITKEDDVYRPAEGPQSGWRHQDWRG